jgi:hypothetical protein
MFFFWEVIKWTFYWFCLGIKIALRWFKMRALEGNATWQANISKNLGKKKENFNDNLYIEEGLSLESSL